MQKDDILKINKENLKIKWYTGPKRSTLGYLPSDSRPSKTAVPFAWGLHLSTDEAFTCSAPGALTGHQLGHQELSEAAGCRPTGRSSEEHVLLYH